jgi:hypothetical protein
VRRSLDAHWRTRRRSYVQERHVQRGLTNCHCSHNLRPKPSGPAQTYTEVYDFQRASQLLKTLWWRESFRESHTTLFPKSPEIVKYPGTNAHCILVLSRYFAFVNNCPFWYFKYFRIRDLLVLVSWKRRENQNQGYFQKNFKEHVRTMVVVCLNGY